MAKPNRDTFRKLTPAHQRASMRGSIGTNIKKKQVYEEMKRQRDQEQKDK